MKSRRKIETKKKRGGVKVKKAEKKSEKSVKFSHLTVSPRSSKLSTTKHDVTLGRVPTGTERIDSNGRVKYTGDFRGLGVINPWGNEELLYTKEKGGNKYRRKNFTYKRK